MKRLPNYDLRPASKPSEEAGRGSLLPRLVMPLHGAIVSKIEEVPEMMGFDHAIVELRSGHVLEIGDCGVNAYKNRTDFMDGIGMMGGIEFTQHNAQGMATAACAPKNDPTASSPSP